LTTVQNGVYLLSIESEGSKQMKRIIKNWIVTYIWSYQAMILLIQNKSFTFIAGFRNFL
jgi:hypothetical protein